MATNKEIALNYKELVLDSITRNQALDYIDDLLKTEEKPVVIDRPKDTDLEIIKIKDSYDFSSTQMLRYKRKNPRLVLK